MVCPYKPLADNTLKVK